MNILKKIIFFLLLSFLAFSSMDLAEAATREVWNSTIKDVLLWISENEVLPEWDDWLWVLQSIFVWIKTSLTGLLLLLAVWVFLFIWIRLWIARWNPEEFKKSMMHLVYAIIWIFIVSIAYATVTLVAWLTL